MKWPWTRRVEVAQERARSAEQELELVRDRWGEVHAVTGETGLHRRLNGWTENVTTIFSGR